MALLALGPDRPVVMLNLLKFREVAEYSHAPEAAPKTPVSGAEAYERYIRELTPHLRASGGEVLFDGTSGGWLIGPEGEGWDRVLLVRQASVAAFLAFAEHPQAQRIGHHRTAALADSRLLPVRPVAQY